MKTSSSGRDVQCVEFAAAYSIGLRADDRAVLVKIKDYFGCGELRGKKSSKDAPSSIRAGLKDPKPQVTFKIRNPEDLISVVIPHFEKFPLQSKKAADFEIWKRVVEFAVSELRGKKGWLRRHPEKVEDLSRMCMELKEVRAYRPEVELH